MPRPSQSNRREFLAGKSARDALTAQFAPVGMPVDPGNPSAAPLIHLTRRAMACGFSIFLDARADQSAVEAAIAALDLLEPLEADLSIYRPDSEISRLNRSHGERIHLSPQVFDLLRQAVMLNEKTAGAFDITAGPLARAWGFVERSPRKPTQDELDAALAKVGSAELRLEPDGHWAALGKPGMEVNLGAIGKGHALNRCARVLHEAGVERFLIHGGLSSILASGSRSTSDDVAAGWIVDIKNPLDEQRVLATVQLQNQSMGTSGSAEQHFVDENGQRWGHVVDPRTGYPTGEFLSVSAIATNAADADALATAFYVMGRAEIIAFCDQHPEYSAVMVTAGEHPCIESCGTAVVEACS